jgi:hypothetical protein
MAASDFVSGDSTLVSTKKVSALVEGAMRLYLAEQEANRDSAVKTTYVAFTLTAAATLTLAMTLNLPGKTSIDGAGLVSLKAKNWSAEYVEFEAGTGDITGTLSLADAVEKIAGEVNYWERQIVPNIVINQANQVTVAPDLNTSNIAISINVPVTLEINEEGTPCFKVFDYLYVVPA